MKIQRIAQAQAPTFLFVATCKAERWWSQFDLMSIWKRGYSRNRYGTFSNARIYDIKKTKKADVVEPETDDSPAVYNGWDPFTLFYIQGIWQPSPEEVAKVESEKVGETAHTRPAYHSLCSKGVWDHLHDSDRKIAIRGVWLNVWEIQPENRKQFDQEWSFTATADLRMESNNFTAGSDNLTPMWKDYVEKSLSRSLINKRVMRGAEGVLGDLRTTATRDANGIRIGISGTLITGAMLSSFQDTWKSTEDDQHAQSCLKALLEKLLQTQSAKYSHMIRCSWWITILQVAPSTPKDILAAQKLRLQKIAADHPIFYHGTSSQFLPDIESKGLINPYLGNSYEKAEYYATEVSSEVGGEPMMFQVDVSDLSQLRHDYAAMEEPVLANDADRDLAWKEAARNHPEWIKRMESGKMIVEIPQSAWEISWQGVGSVVYSGVIPFQNLHEV